MSPSDKTMLRRTQRAGQHQRMRQALALAQEAGVVEATRSKPAASKSQRDRTPATGKRDEWQRDEVPRAMETEKTDAQLDVEITRAVEFASPPLVTDIESQPPQLEVPQMEACQDVNQTLTAGSEAFVEALLEKTVLPQKKLTAEAFAEAVCQLVDAYRAGQKNAVAVDATSDNLTQCVVIGDYTCEAESYMASKAGLLGVDKVSAVASKPTHSSAPPTSCPYTVRNTFIDFLPTSQQIEPKMKAVFSTWPEDKPTVAEEEHLCGASTSSHVSGPPGSQLEAGEITEENEDGEISDDDDTFFDEIRKSVDFELPIAWQTIDSPSQLPTDCKVCIPEPCLSQEADDLHSKTQGLKDLLRQSIGCLQSSGVQDDHSTGTSPGGRWRKNCREQNIGKVAIDLASLLGGTSPNRQAGSDVANPFSFQYPGSLSSTYSADFTSGGLSLRMQ